MNQQVKDIVLVIGEATQLANMLTEVDDMTELVALEDELLDSIATSEIGVDRLYVTLKALESKAEYYKELGKELQRKASIIQTQKDRIEGYVIGMVQQNMLPAKLVGTTYRITACQNGVPSLVLTEEQEQELIRAGYSRTKVELDKKAVLEGIKNDELPRFKDVLQRGMHLRFSK